MATPRRRKAKSGGWPRYFRPTVEQLEPRRFPALLFAPILDPDGWLQVGLDDANDVVTVQYVDAQTIRLTVNGTDYDYARSDVKALMIGGGEGDDSIELAADVTVSAVLDGDAGNDYLVGGAGFDAITGGLGRDTLIGNGANDYLGAGDPPITYGDPDGIMIQGPPPASISSDLVLGGDGDDQIVGDAFRDTLDGGAGENDIDTSQGEMTDVSVSQSDLESVSGDVVSFSFLDANTVRAIVNGVPYDFDRSLVTGFYADLAAGNDSITVDAGVNLTAILYGGDGNDTLTGAAGNDYMEGGAGDDWMDGGAGNDWMDGGAGNDTLFGQDGDDTLLGGDGDDYLDGGLGTNYIDGGEGNNTVVGSSSGFGGGGGGR